VAEPARLLDEEAVRRALAEELAPRRVDAVLERARVGVEKRTPSACIREAIERWLDAAYDRRVG